MRCRKGDLAILLKSVCGNEGLIVEVLEYGGAACPAAGLYGDWWYTRIRGRDTNPESGNPWGTLDRNMLPIHPGDLKEVEETEKEVESV